jgi:hypothetical protein
VQSQSESTSKNTRLQNCHPFTWLQLALAHFRNSAVGQNISLRSISIKIGTTLKHSARASNINTAETLSAVSELKEADGVTRQLAMYMHHAKIILNYQNARSRYIKLYI